MQSAGRGVVRCANCETEPLGPRYCECCGREISLNDSQAEETPLFSEQADAADPVSGPDDWAPNPNPTLDLRYEAHQTAAPEASSASSQDASDRATVAKADMPPAQPEATTTPIKEKETVVNAKPIGPEAVKPPESLPKRATSDPIHAERVQRSPAATRRPIVQATVPAAPERQRHSSKVAIGALLIGAVVVGAPWLRVHKESLIARVTQLANVVSSNGVTQVAEVAEVANQPLAMEPPAASPAATPVRQPEPPKERPAVPAKVSQDRKPATAVLPVASTPVRPKPLTPARPPRPEPAKAVASKPVRAKEPTREVPAVAVLAAKPSEPVIAAPVVEVAAAAPAPAPAPRPEAVGPFFESNQVNEPPHMATRVEPRLPVELRTRSVKEIVVVRALVSQSGHPTRISLLRRSKTGPQLDDVVLAAVNQWTFSPARKKGEPVSCWFNFAVPIGQ
jgi:periplasmic protein TonB